MFTQWHACFQSSRCADFMILGWLRYTERKRLNLNFRLLSDSFTNLLRTRDCLKLFTTVLPSSLGRDLLFNDFALLVKSRETSPNSINMRKI